MADTVASQTILESGRKVVIKLTNVSDGTGESAVEKVVPATFGCSYFAIEKVHFSTIGMGLSVLFDATTDHLAFSVAQDMTGTLNFSEFGGIPDPKADGYTGKILLTTTGHSAGDRYTVILELLKGA